MSDEKFDAIIVGGGLAGCSAAIVLARAGLEVLLIERGDYCGAKNMTGGRLYGHSLEKIIPGFCGGSPHRTGSQAGKGFPADSRRRPGYWLQFREAQRRAGMRVLHGSAGQV